MTVKFLRPLVGVMLASVALQACTPTVPDSGSGVGFQDYNSYIRGAQPSAAPSMPVVVPPVGGRLIPPLRPPRLIAPKGCPRPCRRLHRVVFRAV